MTNGEFILVWPVYIVETPEGMVAGHDPASGIVGLSLYTDRDLAQGFVDGGGAWVIRPFNNREQLLDFLTGLTGDFTHVIIDPSPQLNAQFIPISHFIATLRVAN